MQFSNQNVPNKESALIHISVLHTGIYNQLLIVSNETQFNNVIKKRNARDTLQRSHRIVINIFMGLDCY